MNSYLQLVVFFFAAINPAAAFLGMAGGREGETRRAWWRLGVLGGVIALAVYTVATASAGTILSGLEIEPESFRVGAGVVMLTAGAYAIWNPASVSAPERGGIERALFPLALPLLVTPAGLAAAISYGADDGALKAFAALVPAVLLGVALVALGIARMRPAADAVARLTGALLIAVAAGLIVDGVRAI